MPFTMAPGPVTYRQEIVTDRAEGVWATWTQVLRATSCGRRRCTATRGSRR
ncbi:hypothetical protein HNR68_000099 [Saccharopolyspora hordei]|uniref:Uncharacterized protein n=1 Tax=Saccharopolyspora hordei TaxID=1838 RepID=A0A853AEE8_9PSEU|nr:hypothetical protein [Saccharopolyspora hordei]